MKSVVLVGYMCVGKTTIGRSLAKRLGTRFYDLDWYIEERFRSTVSRIFAERGEAAFRDLERRMLHEAAEFEDIVLSCGGGTPCFGDNMDYLLQTSLVCYLRTTPDVIIEHLKISRTERPLLKGLTGQELRDHITNQLAEREPFYNRAHLTFDIPLLGDPGKVERVADEIAAALRGLRS